MSQLNSQVDPRFYNVVRYAGNGDTRRIEFTDAGLVVAMTVAFQGKYKPLTGQAVRMLLLCVDESRLETSAKGFSSTVVNELMEPWVNANDGAVLYPEEFQPWEADAEVFFIVDNPNFAAGNWIASTFHAETAAVLINAELTLLKGRIRLAENLCLAA
jgi:hypothetical protein